MKLNHESMKLNLYLERDWMEKSRPDRDSNTVKGRDQSIVGEPDVVCKSASRIDSDYLKC